MKKWFLIFCLVIGFVAPAMAADIGAKSDFLYGNAYYHWEKRDHVREKNFEFSLGYDHLIIPDMNLFAGIRAGMYREQVLTSIPIGDVKNWPFLGVQAYTLLPLGEVIAFKVGAATDLLITGHTDPNSFPVWWYVGAHAGIRAYLSDKVYLELPAEVGYFPFFDGTPYFAKMGVQLGFAL